MPTLISPLLCVALVAAVDAGGGSQGRSNQQPAAAIGQRRCPAAEQTGGGSAAAPHAQQQHPQTAPAGGDTATKVEPRAGALRPHIVLAIFDDLGYNDLGSFSGGALTPKTPCAFIAPHALCICCEFVAGMARFQALSSIVKTCVCSVSNEFWALS